MSEQPQQHFRSLDLVRQELDMKVAEQESRAASFDTKAGLLLGLGGILIGLSPHHLELFRLLGRLAAAVGAGAAVWSMLPRISAGVVPRELRNKYLSAEPDFTKLRLLDTRILLYERDEKRLTSKVHRMRVAVLFLALAVALLLVGSIVDYVT